MADIEGFCGIRYSLSGGRDISDRLAPPYDTISSPEVKKQLLDRCEHNIVAIDLPHVPPTQAGPEHLYRQSAVLLENWLAQKILFRDNAPAIYLYRQLFNHGGKQFIRRGFVARLRLEEFGSGHVMPHEQTHSGPKEDRLLLTKATRASTSQIFCLYEDPENEIAETLYTKAEPEPNYFGTLDGVQNEVWVVTERTVQHWLADKMASRPVFIADGHHRYSTALLYRDYLLRQQRLNPYHPANYVACMFVSMSEPGLLVLPTHRAVLGLNNLSLDRLVDALGSAFHHQWLEQPARPEELEAAVNQIGGQAFAFITPDDAPPLVVWPDQPEQLLDDLADQFNRAWRMLPVSILHKHIFERVIFPEHLVAPEPSIRYFHLASELSDFVRSHPGSLGVVLPPASVEAVREVCTDRQLMPQKSTYFYPKLATGLVIYPMFD